MKISVIFQVIILMSVIYGVKAEGCQCRDTLTNEVDADTTTECCGQVEGSTSTGLNCVVEAEILQELFIDCCVTDGEDGTCI